MDHAGLPLPYLPSLPTRSDEFPPFHLPEINEVLVRMLDIDFCERMTLQHVRYAVDEVNSFYSDGSVARCLCEQGGEINI